MPCYQPFRGDTSQMLLFKIASCLEASGGGAGVTSFNGLTGPVTGVTSFNGRDGVVILSQADVAAVADARYVLKAGDTMTGSLAMPAGSAALPSNTFSGDLNTGLYSPGADSVGFSTGGTLRLTVASTAVTSTVPILAPDGTAALPAFSFSADPDTGIYRIGANVLGVSVGGVQIGSWNSIGLGVGTTGAVFKLDLVGTATTAHRKIGINGTQVVYLPDQAAGVFSGSIFFGNGGASLTHAAGTEGQFNTGVGIEALRDITTGAFNTATGWRASVSNTTGANNTAIGYRALFSNLTGATNTAIGTEALFTNTASTNVALGYRALFSNTTGTNNTAIGYQTIFSNLTGNSCVAIGYQALFTNTASNNFAIGFQSLFSTTTGANNTAIGLQTLFSNTTSPNNSAFGFQALFDLTTAVTGQNTAIGYNTGRGITTGSNNTIIGANVTGLAAALSNNIILADGAGVIRLQIDSSGNTTLAGTVATAAGTAALPAHTFSADLNTGLYNIGADSVGLSTGGTLRTTTNTTDLILATAFRLAFASGANARAGNAVLVGGTVTVANTSVTANTIILLTRKTSGGTIGFAVTYTVIAATSFTLTSDSALDTSTYSYLLIENP